MENKNIAIILCVLFLTGCVDTDNLDAKFADYFRLLNSSEDRNTISKARQEVEQIFLALEAERSEHLEDFKYLLNSYRATEIIAAVNNPEEMKRYLRLGLHPLTDVEFKRKYQKAEEPESFSPMNLRHVKGLRRAVKLSEKLVYSKEGRNYNFSELIDAWAKLKKLNTAPEILEKLAGNLQKGTCFGVSTFANSLVCKDPSIGPQKIINELNKNIDQVIALQIQQNMAVKVYNKTRHDAARVFADNYKIGPNKKYLQGFKLRSEVKLYMAKLLEKPIRKGQDFVARVTFSGDKSGHAVAIQRLEGGRVYRLIDNNIGVLSFSTLEEFLEAFSTYRLVYYGRSTQPIMWVWSNYC